MLGDRTLLTIITDLVTIQLDRWLPIDPSDELGHLTQIIHAMIGRLVLPRFAASRRTHPMNYGLR